MHPGKIINSFSIVIYVFWCAESEFQLSHHEKVMRYKQISKQNGYFQNCSIQHTTPTLVLWMQFWPNSLCLKPQKSVFNFLQINGSNYFYICVKNKCYRFYLLKTFLFMLILKGLKTEEYKKVIRFCVNRLVKSGQTLVS